MRTQRIIGNNRFLDQIRALRLDARIKVLAVVAVGPAIEAAIFHGRHVVRHEVRTEFVTLVDDGPERAGLRLASHSVRIAQAARMNSPAPAGAVDLPDRSAVFFRLHAVLGDIAVGAHADIKQRTVPNSPSGSSSNGDRSDRLAAASG